MERLWDDLHLPFWLRVAIHVVCFLTFAFLVLPVLIIFPLSFSASPYLEFPPRGWSLAWYSNYANRPEWVSATIMSFRVGFATALLSTVVGTLGAIALTRYAFPGRRALFAVVVSPIIMPGIVLAVALYFFLAELDLAGTATGLVLAHTILAVPYVVLAVAASLHGFDRSLESAAMSLGAGPTYTFFRVTLPLIRPGILAGLVFAFVASFDELIVAIFITGPLSVTLPVRMWEGVRLELDPTISAVAAAMIAISAVTFVAVRWLQARSTAGHL
jgi:putative spermidine/putrescine transport system permease protein